MQVTQTWTESSRLRVRLPASHEAMILWAMISLMARRLARQPCAAEAAT